MCVCGRLAVVCGLSLGLSKRSCDEPPVPGPGRPGAPELRLPTITLGLPGVWPCRRVRQPGAWVRAAHRGVDVSDEAEKVYPSPYFLTQTGDWICSLGSQGPQHVPLSRLGGQRRRQKQDKVCRSLLQTSALPLGCRCLGPPSRVDDG